MSISSSQLFLIWSPSSSGVPSISPSNDMSFALSSPTPLGLPPPTRVLSWAIFGIRSPEVPSPTPSPIALPVGESSGRTTSSRVLPSGSISAAAATAAASASTATADTSAASPARTTATAVASPSRCPSWFSSARSPPLAFHVGHSRAVSNLVEYGSDFTISVNWTFRNLVPSAMSVPGHILLFIGETAFTPHLCSFARITSSDTYSAFFVPCCVLPLSVILLVVVVFPWSVFLVDICSVPLSTFLVIVCAAPSAMYQSPPLIASVHSLRLTKDSHWPGCLRRVSASKDRRWSASKVISFSLAFGLMPRAKA
ncbi:hypothetical protein N1851_004117 [Merluccius polli]|uniref:Uncharacterized protein n=1 Tax=Merluccius polli TaxID=89951 RepID=A0AA47N8E6_MERPO|nr:hypothetical protein N1851_004117 [Merluccius polli]